MIIDIIVIGIDDTLDGHVIINIVVGCRLLNNTLDRLTNIGILVSCRLLLSMTSNSFLNLRHYFMVVKVVRELIYISEFFLTLVAFKLIVLFKYRRCTWI